MKIAFLAGQSSIHTVKWVNEMASRGHEIHLMTMHSGSEFLNVNIKVYTLPFKPPLGYYLNFYFLKKLLKQINPEVMNTHYASGYGTLARLSGFKPNILSVWGSDVFDFPYRSRFQMRVLRKNLQVAYKIASTSYVMKKQTESIFKPAREIAVTPFGVDCEKFSPDLIEKNKEIIRIGTVKSMSPKYGISTLINAFDLLKKSINYDIELYLVGGGPQEEELKQMVLTKGISDCVKFIGPVPNYDVPKWLNSFDIYAALSESESFGVAVVEASACGVPVVVSDAGGLPEVVVDGETGYIVPRNNPELAAEKIKMLIDDKNLRIKMGKNGRNFVLKNYEWKENADRMETLYWEVVSGYNGSNNI